jgi:hypothetical protein
VSDTQTRLAHERDYIARTIETVRNHKDADNSWPQWANIFADQIESLEAELERVTENAAMWSRLAHENAHRGDDLEVELERVTAALREIAHYEEPWPQDPSDVYEHFQAVARAALAGGARAAQETTCPNCINGEDGAACASWCPNARAAQEGEA